MAQGLVIPSIFTVIDQVSPKLGSMQHNISAFGTRSEESVNRANSAFRRLVPGLGSVQSQLASMIGTGAALAGAFQVGSFAFNSLADYEVAVDSFRVIVSDLNDTDFSPFQKKIDEIAKRSGKSGTEVAQAFEKIAGINSTFAQTSEGLGQVTDATITLAKASRMDLGVAAENLVGIMNQFSFSADKADRTINVLAAGQAVGAANISQTAEAFTVFGSIAAGANITLEQSVGLIQTLGKYSLYGAEAGTKLRGSILRLQKAGLGYASGQFNVNDALNQTNTVLSKVKTAKEKDAIVNKLFGVENVTAGKILLKNVDTYHKFTAAVTGTQEAQKGAAINTGNLKTAISELTAGFSNVLTGSTGAKEKISEFTSVIHYLTENMDTIVSTLYSAGKAALYLGTALLAVKTYLIATSLATTGINIAIGVMNALFTSSVTLTYANATAQKAYMVTSVAFGHVLEILNGNFAALNATMAANPVGIIIIGIAALAAGIGYLIYKSKELREEYQKQIDMEVGAAKSGEAKRLDNLIDKYVKLGKSRKDAALMAIHEEQADIAIKQSRISGEVATAQKAVNEKNIVIPGLGNFNLPGREAAAEKLLEKQREAKMLSARRAQLAEFVKEKTTMDVKPSASFGESDKFTQSESAALLQTKTESGTSAGNIKDEITIKVKNDSDTSVSVGYGKTKATDVMPKVESTKTLSRNGRQ